MLDCSFGEILVQKNEKNEKKNLSAKIAEAIDGLIYRSEIDAEFTVFSGPKVKILNGKDLLRQIGKSDRKTFAEKDFADFFAQLTTEKDWYDEDERKMTENFSRLKDLLEQNLRDLKVFRIGKKDIEILVVGLDSENIVRGILTQALET